MDVGAPRLRREPRIWDIAPASELPAEEGV
jgi:hypothetical protein